jgi:hypothetical protein
MHVETSTADIFSLAENIYELLLKEYKANNLDQNVTCALESATTLWDNSTFPGVSQVV